MKLNIRNQKSPAQRISGTGSKRIPFYRENVNFTMVWTDRGNSCVGSSGISYFHKRYFSK